MPTNGQSLGIILHFGPHRVEAQQLPASTTHVVILFMISKTRYVMFPSLEANT